MEPLQKSPSGISGLDEILLGGLPKGRSTFIFGGPGCGKSALAMEFLCRGAQQFHETGLFVSFEESPEDIQTNFASCTFGFAESVKNETVHIESILLDGEFTVQAGTFTLDGLLIRLDRALQISKAGRLVLDNLNALTTRFSNTENIRYEVWRILQWIKNKRLTSIISSEQRQTHVQTHGFEEYIADCVIHLDHRVNEQISKRRIRVIKYRGTSHGKDEYPFLIAKDGISILPISALNLDAPAPAKFISTGIDGLDRMLDGKGYYQGSTTLISGCAGTGKSTVAACFAEQTCQTGGRSLILPFEESTQQILRNLRSVGMDLTTYLQNNLLTIEPIRPSTFGLEEHLVRIHTIIEEFQPETIILDPITSFTMISDKLGIRSMLLRLLDHIKMQGINVIMSSLTQGSAVDEETETEVSSIVDTWIIIRFHRDDGDRRRQIYIHKARGIGHSQSIGELVISSSGVSVLPTYNQHKSPGSTSNGRKG